MRHFLHPLAMVHCFSILLVKAMQLRSMVFVGLGGKISQVNQLVCLLFMLLVQVKSPYIAKHRNKSVIIALSNAFYK